MLEALLNHGLQPDLLVGTSVGALNAAFLAQGPTLDGCLALQGIWKSASREKIFPIRPRTLLLGAAGRRDHLVVASGLSGWLEAHLSYRRFEDATIPLHVVATDIQSGDPVVLSEGPLVPALLASAALPGIFPPVVFEGRTLVDGGISADAPVLQAEALGATEIWVLPTSGPERRAMLPRGALEVLLRAIGIALGHVTQENLARLGEDVTVHVLPGPAVEDASILDFGHSDELIAAGRALTVDYLERLPSTAGG
ncbi:MAG: esterase (alpha-beta hydrolase superfamily) [Actinomycetia bacterium]|nr:esterase (alpha-beta hydrolase superfamily) [Actinomycetes bacterium]